MQPWISTASWGSCSRTSPAATRRRFEERAQALSLTLPQCRALLYLENNEGVSQKRLSELTELDPMTLVRILDRMEADGWVQRRFDPADRRAHTLWLTPKSKPVLDHIAHVIAETRAETLHGLPNEDRARLIELLERVHGNLSSLAPLAVEKLAVDKLQRSSR